MNNKPVLYWWTRFAASFVRGAATVVLVWSTIGLAVAFADPSITVPLCSHKKCTVRCTGKVPPGGTCTGKCDQKKGCDKECPKGCVPTYRGNLCECQ